MKLQLARILLVEDDLDLASAYRTRLEAEDFEVRVCSDGTQTLTEAQKYKPDLILLDLMMPKISGFDVLDILRNTTETADIKIIILSALSRPTDRARAKELGADEYLVKSQAVIAEVIRRIRYHLGLPQPE